MNDSIFYIHKLWVDTIALALCVIYESLGEFIFPIFMCTKRYTNTVILLHIIIHFNTI